MKQPIEPDKADCCNSGCNPCIFDVYEQQLKHYKKFLETGETSENQSDNGIKLLEYTSFVLVKVVELCEAHIQLFFKRSCSNDGKNVWWKPGDHFLLKYKNKDSSCNRAYTPLIHRELNKECDFSIIVKVYKDGLVSNYLNKLKISDETLWRGPYGAYNTTLNMFKRIIMIAQGTGLAPFISIIESILNNEDDMTKIVLYYCVKNEDLILLRDELYRFKDFWNFSYRIFLSHKLDSKKCKYQEPLMYHKLELEDVKLLKPFICNDQLLLCGSQEFMGDMKSLFNENGLFENICLF